MSDVARDLTGELLDRRFHVEQRLGSGGMGTVWQVQHVESLQRFALKTLAPDLAGDPGAIDRFLREARAAAALRTRHVVRVIDVQMGYRHQGEPLPFIVMERLEGFNLEQLASARHRLSRGEVVWVLRQVGRALGVAHGRGIVHRDLKAANIFIAIDEEGEPIVKLCDFGIAKLLGDSAHSLARTGEQTTGTGAFLGTPLYMAPEQLSRGGKVTPATDQWALALIAFRALTGQEYFGDAESPVELVLRILRDPLRPPSEFDSGLGTAFDAWFLRACTRDPGDRYRSVEEQIQRFEEALERPSAEPLWPRLAPAPSVMASGAGTTGALIGTPRPPSRGIGFVVLTAAATLAVLIWAYASAGTGWEHVVRSSLGRAAAVSAASAPAEHASALPARASAQLASEVPAAPSSNRTTPTAVAPSRSGATLPARTPRPTALARPSASRRPAAHGRRVPGEACASSAECESGLCLAEACR